MFGKKSKRISFKGACEELRVDAVELLRLAGMARIDPLEVWPEMSTKTYALLVPMAPGGIDIMMKKNRKEEDDDEEEGVRLPKGAAAVISKMKARNFWGTNAVSVQGIKKFVPKFARTMDEIIEAMLELGWLSTDKSIKKNPPIALVSKFKNEIENYMHANLKNDRQK